MTQSDIDLLLTHKSIFDANDKQMQKNAMDKEWVSEIIDKCMKSEVRTWKIQEIVAVYVWNPQNTEVTTLIERWIEHFNQE